MTGPEGNSEFCFLRNLNEVKENIQIWGKQKFIEPPKLYSKTKQKQIFKNVLRFQQQLQATFNCTLLSRATVVNIFQVTVHFFSFDIIVFAMLPTHDIWR